jgi:hypothetical protein
LLCIKKWLWFGGRFEIFLFPCSPVRNFSSRISAPVTENESEFSTSDSKSANVSPQSKPRLVPDDGLSLGDFIDGKNVF